MRLLALDPGTTETGWCVLEDGVPHSIDGRIGGVLSNDFILPEIERVNDVDHVAIERIAARGKLTGRDTMVTCEWSARFYQAAQPNATWVYFREAQIALCGRANVGYTEIKQALRDRFGGDELAIGGKTCRKCKGKGWFGAGRPVCPECDGAKWRIPPGPLYGLPSTDHVWAALAVGVVAWDRMRAEAPAC